MGIRQTIGDKGKKNNKAYSKKKYGRGQKNITNVTKHIDQIRDS